MELFQLSGWKRYLTSEQAEEIVLRAAGELGHLPLRGLVGVQRRGRVYIVTLNDSYRPMSRSVSVDAVTGEIDSGDLRRLAAPWPRGRAGLESLCSMPKAAEAEEM